MIATNFYLLNADNLPQRYEQNHFFQQAFRFSRIASSRVSRLPLDDEHFLMESEDTCWKIRFDGQNSEPIFPKDAEVKFYLRESQKKEPFYGGPLKSIPEEWRAAFY